jgi:hypothetical protein
MLPGRSDPVREPTLDRSHKGGHIMSIAGQDAASHVGAVATSQAAELLLCEKETQVWYIWLADRTPSLPIFDQAPIFSMRLEHHIS